MILKSKILENKDWDLDLLLFAFLSHLKVLLVFGFVEVYLQVVEIYYINLKYMHIMKTKIVSTRFNKIK